MRSGAAAPGRGLSRTLRTQLKIVVVAPMPSASVSTAMAVKLGDLRSMRRLKRTSWKRFSISMSLPPAPTPSAALRECCDGLLAIFIVVRLLVPQSHHGIDARSAPRGKEAGRERNDSQSD